MSLFRTVVFSSSVVAQITYATSSMAGQALSHAGNDDNVGDDAAVDEEAVVVGEKDAEVGEGNEGNCCCLIKVQLGAKVAFTLIITD